jgi:hypothetical protein
MERELALDTAPAKPDWLNSCIEGKRDAVFHTA